VADRIARLIHQPGEGGGKIIGMGKVSLSWERTGKAMRKEANIEAKTSI